MKNSRQHCSLSDLKIDGEFTKLLVAYAKLFDLKHVVRYGQTNFGLGLEVCVYAKTRWWESILDVFEEGKVGYVSSMREYTQAARESTIENFSRRILLGTFGKGKYIQSMKCAEDSKNIIKDIPRSKDELLLRLDLAGIDFSMQKIHLERIR